MSSMGAAPGAIRAIRSVTGPHSCHLRRKVSPKPQQNHRPGDVHSASRMILMMNVHFPHFPYASMIFYVLLCHHVTTDCGLASCKCKPCRFDT